MSKNTILDGIAASEHLDSSGETLSIEGMDISSLGGPDSILNWEHGSKDKPSQVVGKVTFARKIFKKEDCKTRREKYFWNKSKKPFVYVKAELFDGLGHSGAQDVAAMLKYKNKDKGEDSRLVVGFSIEGGKMDKKGMAVTKSIARDIAITVKPCNKVCDAEILENTKDDKDFLYKNQNFDCEILEKGDIHVNSTNYEKFSKTEGKFRAIILDDIKKGERKLSNGIKPKREYQSNDTTIKDTKLGDRINYKKKPKTGKDIYNDPKTWETSNNMRKALIAGVMSGAPSGLTGMAALATEELVGSKKKAKKVKKTNHHPDMGKSEIAPKPKNNTYGEPEGTVYGEVDHSVFHKHVDSFRNSSELASANIHPYEREDYSKMRTFMSPDRKSGYAIKNGDELVSVHSQEKGRGEGIVRHAVGSGAKKLDAYDIKGKLPSLYGKFGFKETGRYGFDPQYADPSNKTLHSHKPDFVEMRIAPPDMEKNQPNMGFKSLGIENKPNMQVKTVNPEKSFKTKSGQEVSAPELEGKKIGNKYVQGQKKISGADNLSDFSDQSQKNIMENKQAWAETIDPTEQGGVNISDPEHGINESIDFKGKGQSKEEMKETKGKGNFPTTRHHEGLHHTFGQIASDHSPQHSKNLVSHIMDNFFHKEDMAGVGDFISQSYDKDDPHLKEEHLTHVLDLLTDRDKRDSHNELFMNGKARDVDMKRLKSGWKNAVNFTNSLDKDGLDKINNFYSKKSVR